MEKIGFIGLGAMGRPMATNLVNKGFQLVVFDNVREKIQPLKELGAEEADSCRQVAERCNIVITIVPSSPHVRQAILGSEGVIAGIKKGSVVIDMSTIDPMTSREVAKTLAERSVEMLDAPVARTVTAAVAGTLAIYVGGKTEVFERCKHILLAMGTDIYHVGDVGAGEVCKLVNNLIVISTVASVSEAMVLGVKAGVKPDALFEALSGGSANSFVLQNHFKNCVLKGKFEEGVFSVDYTIKDLGLVLDTGVSLRVPLHYAALTNQLYIATAASGENKRYNPVVIRPMEKLAGVEVRSEKK